MKIGFNLKRHIVDNLVTTEKGKLLDASEGKILADKIITANGGCTFSIGEDGNAYVTFLVGADTVTKKLGSSIDKTMPVIIGEYNANSSNSISKIITLPCDECLLAINKNSIYENMAYYTGITVTNADIELLYNANTQNLSGNLYKIHGNKESEVTITINMSASVQHYYAHDFSILLLYSE